MQKVQINRFFKHKLKQSVGDNVKQNCEFDPQRWDMGGQHAHQHDGDDGNVIETRKDANDLPEALWCKLEQGCKTA